MVLEDNNVSFYPSAGLVTIYVYGKMVSVVIYAYWGYFDNRGEIEILCMCSFLTRVGIM